MMKDAAPMSSVRCLPEIREGRWSGRGIFALVLAEFRRSIAAAQRYEALRYRSARDGRVAPPEISRRVFEEFYSVDSE
jgi:hypothetical protein